VGQGPVPGAWSTATYPYAVRQLPGDPTLYRFAPAGGALAPSTLYRFTLVQNDSTAQEHFGVSFSTSAYPSLAGHVAASTATVEADRGPGPVSQTGTYLLGVKVILASAEPIQWDDIDSIEVTGVAAGWQVVPRTRCQWVGGQAPTAVSLSTNSRAVCGATPVYENVLDIEFTAADDAQLPASGAPSISVRLNHRREGWNTFTFTVPPPPTLADLPLTEVGPVGPPPPPAPNQTVDVTPPARTTTRRGR
jgi:hypothetical protein